MVEGIGTVVGAIKAGVSLYEHLQRRRGFERLIAKKIVGSVPGVQNEAGLTKFFERENIHWLLVLGPLDGEEELADQIAQWLAHGTNWDPADAEVREAAERAARVAMVAYVTTANEAEHRLLMEFRARQVLSEVRKAVRSDTDRPRTSGLPPRTGNALLVASRTDPDAATTLADIFHREDTPQSISYDAAAFTEARQDSPAYRYLGLAAAEYAAAHSEQDIFVRTADQLADRPTPEAARLLVRAALNAPRDVAERLIDRAAELNPQDRGPALLRADWSEAWTEIVELVPEDTTDSLESLYLARALVHLNNTAAAIRVLDHAAANVPSNAFLLTKAAGLRLTLFGREAADGQVISREPRSLGEREVIERARADAVFAEGSIRRWGGNAAEPLTVAVHAAVRLHDAAGAIRLARTPDGTDFVEEVSNPDVAAAVAGAAAILQDHETLEAVIAHVPDGFDRDMVLGFYYHRLGGADDVALQHYNAALDSAPDVPSLLRPLFALAHANSNVPPDHLERARSEMPNEALLIEAVAAMSADDYETARATLDRLPAERTDEPEVAAVRAEALLGLGRTDEAVRVLEHVFEQTGEVAFLFRAVSILVQTEDGESAIGLCEQHLDSPRPGNEASIRIAAMQLAADFHDWGRLQRHAEAALVSGQIEQSQGRRALIFALWNQAKHRRAYEVLSESDLKPKTEVQARMALALLARFGSGDVVSTMFDTADGFADSEEIRAAVLTEFMMMRSKTNMPTTALGRFRQQLHKFEHDFPSSNRIVAIPFSKNLEEMKALLRADAVPETVRSLLRKVFAGQLPLGMASVVGRSTYMETIVSPPTGFRYAGTLDLSAWQDEVRAANEAIERNSRIVVDLSAIALLVAAGIDPVTVLGRLEQVIVTGATARDAEMGRVNLERRPTLFAGTDDSGQIRVDEISDAEADRRANMAAAIKDFVELHCIVREAKGGDDEAERDWPFLTSLRLAQEQNLFLLTDDVPVRQLAVHDGTPTLGSVALLHAVGRYGPGEQDTMRRIGVVDLPFEVSAYLSLAADENWVPGAAAVPLLRPATFQNMDAFRHYYRECVVATAGDNPAAAAGWVRAASVGFTFTSGIAPERAAGLMLGIAIAETSDASAVPYFVAGARAASHDLGGADPLPVTASMLAGALKNDDPTTSAQRFSAVFSECDDDDRLIAGHEFLKP